GHPAMTACETYIASHPVWITNIANLVELWRILISVYGVSESDADAKFADLRSALVVEDMTATIAAGAFPSRQSYRVDFNDAVLLETARHRGVAVLATDDSQL